ncbi:MAG: hypothetical protein ABSF92_11205 [Candidatus Acidiferrales bacterium]|jgi:hypothetical protein
MTMSFAERRRFLWILFLIGLVLIAVVARATTLARLSFEDLAARADSVVRARCLSTESRWENGEIWTFSDFEVLDAPKGLVGGLITVRGLGGRADGFVSTVEAVPHFSPGEEVYLFLLPARTNAADARGPSFLVLGWAQGAFRVHRDARTGRATVTQDSAGLAVFDPRTRAFRRENLRNLPVEIFEQRLRAALARAPEQE